MPDSFSHIMTEDGRLERQLWWGPEDALHRWRGPRLTICDRITLTPSLRAIARIARLYGVSLNELMDCEEVWRRLAARLQRPAT